MLGKFIAELICVLLMIIGFALMRNSEGERKQFTIGLVILTIGLVVDVSIAGAPLLAIICLIAMIVAYIYAQPILW